ncbi:TWiK family of potassium channels protein 18-like [Octopus sinensis]|uniref:TWiK family of potassium channels protein 18-like n=1 Tax=Octopus sinensis TaxID=2607531 RepID=A0A6P7TIS5_9MOLL|nr:TWiK family of potassium channels protein 18-like [Octopus sinensis]XP_036368094.1 TWiK family of potassium channels protein 18-like [Octopus sinensis]XP_036368096.1 TWiK family of potassium channels protein 18-like [Octopus sinensis]XP_036368097.1 TWiK family of potassium channels protein 18-like [Octopus sinensis]
MSQSKEKSACVKSAMKFLFSHIGLFGMVIAYCVAGAFIFEHLERENEIKSCRDSFKEYTSVESKTLEKLLAIESNSPSKKSEIEQILKIFRDSAMNIGYTGEDCDTKGLPGGSSLSWSLPGALLFAVTIVSTIGYGHIAPKTTWGRLVCIAYAILGIPLMLLCLANIGDALANVFRFVYSKIICCGFCRRKPKKDRTSSITSLKNTSQAVQSQKKNFDNADTNPDYEMKMMGNEKNSYDVSVIEEQKYEKKVTTTKFSNMDSPSHAPYLRSRPNSVYNDSTSSALSQGGEKNSRIYPVPIPKDEREPIMLRTNEYDDYDYDYDDDDDDELADVTIPLTVTMLVIFVYIMFGALLFKLWEGWDLLQATYFCFITLSTIGFGDVVPGTDFDNPQTNIQLIVGGFYILFGMAIVSMCFSLMQEEMVAKFQWIMKKLGIYSDDED